MPGSADRKEAKPGAEPIQGPDPDRVHDKERFVLQGLHAGQPMPDIENDRFYFLQNTDMPEFTQQPFRDQEQQQQRGYPANDLNVRNLPAGIPEQGIDLTGGQRMDHVEPEYQRQPEYEQQADHIESPFCNDGSH